MNTETEKKVADLKEILRSLDSVLVCFSGGVDSTFLLKTAIDELGRKKAAGLLIKSNFQPSWVIREAECVGRDMGAKVVEIDQDVLLIPEIKDNQPERCYHCKREILEVAISTARSMSLKQVIEGTIVDDLEDYRPGRRAVEELGVRSPLLEVGLTKNEIREASKLVGLPTWDKPGDTCLATRFPVGTEIDADKLEQVAKCELVLKDEGFKVFRVRYHGNLARIEVEPADLKRMFSKGIKDKVVSACKEAGFKYVSMDLEGYRSGSMNPPDSDNIQEK